MEGVDLKTKRLHIGISTYMKQERNYSGFSLITAVLTAFVILGSILAIASVVKRRADLRQETSRISAIKTNTEQVVENTRDNAVTAPESEKAADKPAPEEAVFSGTVLSGKKSKLLEFNKIDYDAALRTEKLIVIYFYADWCPICQAELPNLYAAFNELETDKVIGFRVNFNDDQTDMDEKNLAREFGIAYQHAKIFISKGRRVLKAEDPWQKDQYLEKIKEFSE